MKTVSRLVILAFALISIGFTSCSPVAYSTTGQTVPLFQERGEAVVSVGYSAATNDFDYADGLSVQAALAIDSSVALMSSFYHMSQRDGDWSGKGTYADFGIGLFKSNSSKRFKGEIFIGAGFGSIKNLSSDNISMEVKFFKPFIQPSGGFTLKHFEIAITPRIGLVSMNPLAKGEYTIEKKTTFVFEPGLTIRAGFKYVKFQYQTNVSTFTVSEHDTFTTYNFYGSLGVSFLISKRWADQ